MLESGSEVYLMLEGMLERVIVIKEISFPRHAYLDSYPDAARKVAIQRSPGGPVEVVLFNDLRFG